MRRSRYATFSEACDAIGEILADGEWHGRTDEIGRLSPWVSKGMYLRVKTHLKIEHRQVGGGHGSYFEWRLLTPPIEKPIGTRSRAPSAPSAAGPP